MNLKDARVQKTRNNIHQVFFKLLKEKPISRITVSEICQQCQINRSTFYKHYADPYDLLENRRILSHTFGKRIRKQMAQ